MFLTNPIDRLLQSYLEPEFLNIPYHVSLKRHPDKNVAIMPFLKNIFIIFCYISMFIIYSALNFLRVSQMDMSVGGAAVGLILTFAFTLAVGKS